MRISTIILYTLIVFLPVNLGLHFIPGSSYIGGLVVDYLIPTLFVQDILVLLFVLAVFVEEAKIFRARGDSRVLAITLAGLFGTILLSVLFSSNPLVSFVWFLRFFLYGVFAFLISARFKFKEIFPRSVHLLSFSILFLCFLGFFQFFKQGSVFNNYLFLGEQPYSFSTKNINKESLFGFTVVPPYGLFRHPNILGGFLCVTLLWVFSKLFEAKFYTVVFVLGTVLLLLTFSLFSALFFALGIALFFLKDRKKFSTLLVVTVLVVLVSSVLAFALAPDFFSEDPSFRRREVLLSTSYKMLPGSFLFGVGPGNSVAEMSSLLPYTLGAKFLQPVHNIFVLLLLESGIFVLAFFLVLLGLTLKKALEEKPLLAISLVQIIALGCFDHYFLTIHQPLLLLWFLIGLVWTS